MKHSPQTNSLPLKNRYLNFKDLGYNPHFTIKLLFFEFFVASSPEHISTFATPPKKNHKKSIPFERQRSGRSLRVPNANKVHSLQTNKWVSAKETAWWPRFMNPLMKGIGYLGVSIESPNRARAPRPQKGTISWWDTEKKNGGLPYFPLSHAGWFKTGCLLQSP